MPQWRCVQSLARIGVPVLVLAALAGCAKDVVRVDRNRPPRTYIVAAPAESTTASYRVHLYWKGEDPDGYVTGYAWAFDSEELGNYRFTTKTDSIFELTVNDSADVVGGSQLLGVSKIHTFFVRAIDNLGKPDASPAFFNRRLYRATTFEPRVRFLPGDVSGAGGDTLADGRGFRVCWTGNDSDGVVQYYKFDVGPHRSLLQSDTCAYFNYKSDSGVSGSLGLVSGAYTMTVTAVDNAYAVGRTRYPFVVNYDPETWFKPYGGPIGHYIRYHKEGFPKMETGTFAPGDTVPFRSTVWFEWDAVDSTGGEPNQITGWSISMQGGTRDNGEPYTIGFLDTLAMTPSVIRFTTNNPATLGLAGFNTLILDSLDASYNIRMVLASRDGSFRADGTRAEFPFNCNRPPRLDALTEQDISAEVDPAFGIEPCKLITWTTYDDEDGISTGAKITLDSTQSTLLTESEQSIIIPHRVFRQLAPSNPHRVDVRVTDRAGIEALEFRTVSFDLP